MAEIVDTKKPLTGHALKAHAQISTMQGIVTEIVDELEKNGRLGSIKVDPIQMNIAKGALKKGFEAMLNSIGGRK